MFRQVHRRLTFLCAGITILVLILMSCSYLYISEKNLRESSFTSFQNDMNTLLSNLENQTVITHEWLSKMEGNGKYLLSLRDNGQDFLWGRQEHDPAYREAIDAGWNYYDANSGGSGIRNFLFPLPAEKMTIITDASLFLPVIPALSPS